MRPPLFSQDELARRLRNRGSAFPQPDSYPDDFFASPPIPAAVLMPLFLDEGEWRMLFIRRAENKGDRHSGQVAFPGGKLASLDMTPVDAALREAWEEIGLDAGHIEVLGCLEQYRTITNFLVQAVVGRVEWPLLLRPDPLEVSRIFSIPVQWLADPDNLQVSRRTLPDGQPLGTLYRYVPYGGEVLWGVSARLVISLLQLLGISPLTGNQVAADSPRVAQGSGPL